MHRIAVRPGLLRGLLLLLLLLLFVVVISVASVDCSRVPDDVHES